LEEDQAFPELYVNLVHHSFVIEAIGVTSAAVQTKNASSKFQSSSGEIFLCITFISSLS
jgi:hypothetical protein